MRFTSSPKEMNVSPLAFCSAVTGVVLYDPPCRSPLGSSDKMEERYKKVNPIFKNMYFGCCLPIKLYVSLQSFLGRTF